MKLKMKATIVVDSEGRIELPGPLRREFHLGPGDTLEMESVGEQITLRPTTGTSIFQKEQGIWVFRCGTPLSATATDDTLQKIRSERDVQNAGIDE